MSVASRESSAAPRGAWDAARGQLGEEGLLSVVMPAYRLGNEIAANVMAVHDLLEHELPFEIVVVDDGSQDRTRAELETLAAAHPGIRPVYLETNMGKGNAVSRGYHHSRGNYILFLDADLDLPPHQTATLFDVMAREHADIVIGSKRHPQSELNYPWQRRLVSAIYYWFVKLLIGLPLRDTQTGIKLFRREALDKVIPQLSVKGFAFDIELLVLAHVEGFRIAESPVKLEFKSNALGCLRPRTVWHIVRDTLKIFRHVMRLRRQRPAR